MKKEEVLEMVDAYNNGEYSFAEILLASGWSVKQLCQLFREEKIPLNINIDFVESGRGLKEKDLQMLLDGLSNSR